MFVDCFSVHTVSVHSLPAAVASCASSASLLAGQQAAPMGFQECWTQYPTLLAADFCVTMVRILTDVTATRHPAALLPLVAAAWSRPKPGYADLLA